MILIDGLPDQLDEKIESKWRRGKLLMLQADIRTALCGKEKAAKLYYEAIEIWHGAVDFYSGLALNPDFQTYTVKDVKGRLQRKKCYADTVRQARARYYERHSLFHYAQASGDWEYVEKSYKPDVEHGCKWTSWILSPCIHSSFAGLDAEFQSELQNISWWRTAPAKRVECEPEPLQAAGPGQFLDKLEYYLDLDGKDRLNYAFLFISKNEPGILSWDLMNIVAAERYRRGGDKAVIWKQMECIRETAEKRMDLYFGNKKEYQFIRDGSWGTMAECVWMLYRRLIQMDGEYWFREYFSFVDANPLMFKALRGTGITSYDIEKELEPYYNLMMKDGTLLGERLDALILEEVESKIQERKKELARNDYYIKKK